MYRRNFLKLALGVASSLLVPVPLLAEEKIYKEIPYNWEQAFVEVAKKVRPTIAENIFRPSPLFAAMMLRSGVKFESGGKRFLEPLFTSQYLEPT